jgi:hypothetical protein
MSDPWAAADDPPLMAELKVSDPERYRALRQHQVGGETRQLGLTAASEYDVPGVPRTAHEVRAKADRDAAHALGEPEPPGYVRYNGW